MLDPIDVIGLELPAACTWPFTGGALAMQSLSNCVLSKDWLGPWHTSLQSAITAMGSWDPRVAGAREKERGVMGGMPT